MLTYVKKLYACLDVIVVKRFLKEIKATWILSDSTTTFIMFAGIVMLKDLPRKRGLKAEKFGTCLLVVLRR